jgi:hypothetical protein
MAEDVSKTTIMILLILTIVVSVLSTFIILDRAEQLKAVSSVTSENAPSANNVGFVRMSIAPKPQIDQSSGQLKMNIVK